MRRAAALAAALVAACADSPEPTVLRGLTMGTTYNIKYVGGGEASEVRPVVEAALAEVNALFSTYDESSEISRFNARRDTEPVEASARFAALTRAALDVAARTGGAFDPTVKPLVALYGFGAVERQGRSPADAEIEAVMQRVGHAKLELEGRRLRKARPDLELDYNGIAPGFGVDLVAAELRRHGIASFMVEIGGEVRCAGSKAPEEPWVIGIEGPGEGQQRALVEKVELRDAALATSGSYVNFLRVGDQVFHHIFDPRTGRNPQSDVVSVSVQAPTCELADALATAFMVLGPDGAGEVLAGLPEVGALFLLRVGDGAVEVRRLQWR